MGVVEERRHSCSEIIDRQAANFSTTPIQRDIADPHWDSACNTHHHVVDALALQTCGVRFADMRQRPEHHILPPSRW